MPEIFTSPDGRRLIVRHRGPAGPGVPNGGTTGQLLAKASNTDQDGVWVNPPDGTDAASGPASATANAVALFDGTTGKLLKDSAVLLSTLATVSALALKQDAEAGKGLSQENFTTVLKDKLDALAAHYRGSFATKVALEAVADPVAGDYGTVDVSGSDQIVGFYDAENTVWTYLEVPAFDATAAALALFADGASWDVNDCNIFTDAYKALVDQHDAAIEAVNDIDLTRPHGSVDYFDLSTGTAVVIAAQSDGSSNLVKVAPVTSFGALSLSFDAGASDARLRYTGNETRVFHITAEISADIPINDIMVFGLSKNGSLISSSRVLQKSSSGGAAHSVSLSTLVSLALNDYIEVLCGNTTDADDAVVHSLQIDAIPV